MADVFQCHAKALLGAPGLHKKYVGTSVISAISTSRADRNMKAITMSLRDDKYMKNVRESLSVWIHVCLLFICLIKQTNNNILRDDEYNEEMSKSQKCLSVWSHSFIPDISIAPLQVHKLTTQRCFRLQHWYCFGVNTPKCYTKLWVKDLPKAPIWRLEWD